MGSAATPFQLPTIDFCKQLKPGTSEWELVKSQVWEAISKYGCFKALLDKIPLDVQNSFLRELKELFDLPLQTKKCYASDIPFFGYHGQLTTSAQLQMESFVAKDPLINENSDKLTNALWPQGNSNCSKIIQSFWKRVSEFEKVLKRMILESLSLEKYLDEHINSTTYLLRLMKYEIPQTNNLATTSKYPNGHTDKNIMTILYQNEVDGLEVQTKDGEWIGVELSPDNSFFVFLGESFNAWTNGRLHSARHRVRMIENEARISAGLFTTFEAGYVMKAPEELIDEHHPLLFKPFDYFEFLKFHQTWSPKTPDECGLKAYCGV